MPFVCTWRSGCSCQEWLMFKGHKENEGLKCIFKAWFFVAWNTYLHFYLCKILLGRSESKTFTHIEVEIVQMVKESSNLQIIPCMNKKTQANTLIKLLGYVDEVKNEWFFIIFSVYHCRKNRFYKLIHILIVFPRCCTNRNRGEQNRTALCEHHLHTGKCNP